MLRKYAASSIVDVIETPGDMTRKTAERMAVQHELPEGFTPLPGKLYLTTRAISNRVNDNFDFFAAKELLGAFDGAEPHNDKFGYRTFVGSPVFLDHNNTMWDDPRGRIIASHVYEDDPSKNASLQYLAYTEVEDTDTWVKNYFEVDADRYPLTAAAIKLGAIRSTSMGCDIEYSDCSVCGNRAHTTLEYCEHVSNHKNGQKVFSMSDGIERIAYEKNAGLVFFEDSLLTVDPADPTADILQVHASMGQFKNAAELLNLVRQESAESIEAELNRQPDEKIAAWASRRSEMTKTAFSSQVFIGEGLETEAAPNPIARPANSGPDKEREQNELEQDDLHEDDEAAADDTGSSDEEHEGPPQTPTPFSEIDGPFECPAIEFMINPEKCQGCKYNSERNDLVSCNYPEEINPEGRDPKLYEEEYPSGGISATSVGRDGFELFTMAWNDSVWVLNSDTGDFTRYGQLTGNIDDVLYTLLAEAEQEDFVKIASEMFDRPASRDAEKERAIMPQIKLSDRERTKIVLGQLDRMGDEARTQLRRRLADGVADPKDLDNPAVNVVDKGMTDPIPAPQGVTPDDNDDGSGQVPAATVPTVEDEGLQREIEDGEQEAPKAASRRRARARRTAKAPESEQQKQLAAMELVEYRINLGQINPDQKIPAIREVASKMSMDQIQAQIQAYASVSKSASRPLVPRAQKKASSIVSSNRSLPSSGGTSSSDEALAALAANV